MSSFIYHCAAPTLLQCATFLIRAGEGNFEASGTAAAEADAPNTSSGTAVGVLANAAPLSAPDDGQRLRLLSSVAAALDSRGLGLTPLRVRPLSRSETTPSSGGGRSPRPPSALGGSEIAYRYSGRTSPVSAL